MKDEREYNQFASCLTTIDSIRQHLNHIKRTLKKNKYVDEYVLDMRINDTLGPLVVMESEIKKIIREEWSFDESEKTE